MTINRLLAPLALILLWLATPVPVLAATFKLATIAPDGTTWMRELRAGAKEIERRSEGRVRFKFYPGGVMGNDASVLRKIRIGQLHGGAFTGGSLAQVYPDVQIYSLPMLFSSHAEVDYVRERVDPMLYQGLAENGLELLGISDGGFAYVMSGEVFGGLTDLRQQKVWVPQGDVISSTTLRASGISPIQLPLGDVYTGLQTGLIDTVVAVPTGAIAFQWHTRVRHVADVPLAFLTGMLAIDKRRFARLSEADQALTRTVFRDVFQRLDQLNRADNQAAREALIAAGIDFDRPDPTELAAWQAFAERAIDELADKGVYTAGMLSAVRKHLDEYRRQNPTDGG